MAQFGGAPSWPAHVVLLLLGASFFGGCVGSTCGGIKAMRFLLLYRQGAQEINLLFACIFTWGMVAIGHDLVTAFGTVAACMNNMGIGYGETSGGFGTLKEPAKWLMCLAMIFGRLQIFPILIVFSRAFWRF